MWKILNKECVSFNWWQWILFCILFPIVIDFLQGVIQGIVG